jgi:hypothetical protein
VDTNKLAWWTSSNQHYGNYSIGIVDTKPLVLVDASSLSRWTVETISWSWWTSSNQHFEHSSIGMWTSINWHDGKQAVGTVDTKQFWHGGRKAIDMVDIN